jgi:hypothetical protein
MAQTVRPPAVAAALARHLQSGEILRHAVVGREMAMRKLCAVIFASLFPAVLIAYLLVGVPHEFLQWWTYRGQWGAIMFWPARMLAKEYNVALTDRRLLLVHIQTPGFSIDLSKQKSTQSWPILGAPPVEGNVGKLFAKLAILDPRGPV